MNDKRIQLAHRTALTNLVNDIVHEPQFNTRNKKAIAFSVLFTRLFKDTQDLAPMVALSAPACNTEKDDMQHYNSVVRVNQIVHLMRDEDGDLVFNQSTGLLSEKWESDMVDIALALEASTPEAFLPTSHVEVVEGWEHACGVNLINTTRSFAKQYQKYMPEVYRAINALQAQRFTLSEDMKSLFNLPVAIDISKNYPARHIAVCNMEAFKGDFSFRYTMDYRGRVYCRSILVHTQGDSFSKAFIEFAESRPLGKHGMAALKIHFANASGHDKLSFDDRMRWVDEAGLIKAYMMVQCKGDWEKIAPLIEDHKHAFEEYTAACELVRADAWRNEGNAIEDFQSRLVTHQDATNSGFQFGAALTGDRETAEDVNITATQTRSTKPADLYGKMATNLKPLVYEMREVLPTIDRKFCKKPIMVTGYGAGIAAVMRDIQGDYPEIDDEVAEQLQPHVKDALEMTASAMVATTKVMHTHAKEVVENGVELIEWYTPDGLRVVQQKWDTSDRTIELANGQKMLERLPKGEKDPVDESGMTKALPPNFIHSIDAQMLRTAALGCEAKDIHFAPIHDSFGTHAGSFFDLNIILKLSFVQTMEYDWYGEFCSRNNVTPQNIKLGDYHARECLKAVYMFS